MFQSVVNKVLYTMGESNCEQPYTRFHRFEIDVLKLTGRISHTEGWIVGNLSWINLTSKDANEALNIVGISRQGYT